MDPVTLVIAALSVAGASAAKFLVGKVFRSQSGSPTLEVVTADGKKIIIKASQLTREKVEEILHERAASPAAY
jgi:hypothetical protein